MRAYKSRSGKDSGVTGYSPGADFIVIRFGGGEVYKYTYDSAGARRVEQMKRLAEQQKGLSTYISQHQPGYE